MSLTDITCCHGGPHTVECNYCSHSPRYVTRQDIEIEHKRQLARSITFPAGESREIGSDQTEDGPRIGASSLALLVVSAEPRAGARREEPLSSREDR